MWSMGYVSPIYKSGDTSDPNNFRGITVSSCLGKLFTLVLNNRLVQFIEEKGIN